VRKSLTDPASTGTWSRYRDPQQGWPIETEQIVSDAGVRRAPQDSDAAAQRRLRPLEHLSKGLSKG
jgi:hypothetical protein